MSNSKNISEETRTTGRGVKTKGMPRITMQSHSTMPKPAIRERGVMARKVGPKPGQLSKGEKPKPKPEPEVEVSHTVYHDMGYLMAESLGLVSEEDEPKQMDDVGQWNNPGDLKKRAAKAKAAGRKPAKSPITDKNPPEIKKKRGERP